MGEKMTVCAQIEQYILEEIETGRKKSDERLPTENELSQMFHTSRSTVVKALDKLVVKGAIYRMKGSGTYVSPIESPIVSNTVKPKIISLIMPFSANRISIEKRSESQIIRGCENCATANGYILTVSYTGDSIREERRSIENCKEQMSRGIVLCPGMLEQHITDYFSIIFDGFPTILLNKMCDISAGSYVLSDNIQGGYIAAQHLMSCGYNKVYYVSDCPINMYSSIQERFAGFAKFLIENKIPMDETTLIEGFSLQNGQFLFQTYEQNPELYHGVLQNILQDDCQRCGVFCKTDEIAVELLKAALYLGIDVPGRLGIMGFGNTRIQSPVTLSTINQDYFGIGNEAVRLLIDWIERGVHKPVTKYMNTNLVQGETTVCL